jgi:hypothetical protein
MFAAFFGDAVSTSPYAESNEVDKVKLMLSL